MSEAVTLHITGIKGDNPECDYKDDSVNRDNYLEYVDKECPECGSILLTKADYDAVKELEDLSVSFSVSSIIPEGVFDGEIDVRLEVEMNGTGKIEFGKPKIVG